MRKYLFLTTCGAALSALVALGATSPALAQSEQQKHNTPAAEQSAAIRRPKTNVAKRPANRPERFRRKERPTKGTKLDR